MKYRKKPVVIEAMQITGDISISEASGWMLGHKFEDFRIAGRMGRADDFTVKEVDQRFGIEIDTLEGTMLAQPGDWIIRGTHGEFYPIKAHIFEANYEAVEE